MKVQEDLDLVKTNESVESAILSIVHDDVVMLCFVMYIFVKPSSSKLLFSKNLINDKTNKKGLALFEHFRAFCQVEQAF